ncbi:phospholipase, partial [Francisella tularensis subsp. holarctica]|nr:phospholipase [Francisella tularensis subsp. holarctica]
KSYMVINVNLQNGLFINRVSEFQAIFTLINLKIFDFYSLLYDCVENHAIYGFENVTDACIDCYCVAESLGNIQYD